MFEYIWKTETSLNKYENVFERLKPPQTTIWIYLNPKFKLNFKYFSWPKNKKNTENIFLKITILIKYETKQKRKNSKNHSHVKENIWKYVNINTVIMLIEISIRGPQYLKNYYF